ncbi:MAG: SRPBCC family protein [Candidatus Obscuribacterales bacterium]|jgi:hypothetical protein|nr:SRPBCC family protein [Candidatus Obscuribacterales bacterium]
MQLVDTKITVDASPNAAWQKLVDWQRMHKWDIFMDWVKFDGPLALGSVGDLKMTGGPTVKLKVTAFDPPNSYTDEFTMLGSTFVFYHEVMESTDGGAIVRITVDANGTLASMLAPLMRSDFAKKMPILMNNFKRQLEEPAAI